VQVNKLVIGTSPKCDGDEDEMRYTKWARIDIFRHTQKIFFMTINTRCSIGDMNIGISGMKR